MRKYIKTIYEKLPVGVIKKFFKKGNGEKIINKEPAKESNWLTEASRAANLSIDGYEDNNYYVVKTPMAGVRPEDIEVVVDENRLSDKGKIRKNEKIKEENYFYAECYNGNFERIIQLPGEVREDGIEASLKNGMLTVRLVKYLKTGPKSVKVSGNE